MLGVQRRKLNKYQAESAYMTDNAADFPKDSPGDKTAKRFAETVTLIETLAGQQMSQSVRQKFGIKDDALSRLIRHLQKMNRAANALAEDIDGIEDLFRFPRRRSEGKFRQSGEKSHRIFDKLFYLLRLVGFLTSHFLPISNSEFWEGQIQRNLWFFLPRNRIRRES